MKTLRKGIFNGHTIELKESMGFLSDMVELYVDGNREDSVKTSVAGQITGKAYSLNCVVTDENGHDMLIVAKTTVNMAGVHPDVRCWVDNQEIPMI